MTEVIIPLPIFEEAAVALREKGAFSKQLTSQELGQMMSSVVKSLLAGQNAVRATVPTMDVRIERSKGTVAGAVQVESPIKATIKLNCVLGNDTASQGIRLENLDIQQEASFLAKATLKAANIDGQARKLLKDPNQALGDALDKQLRPRGVELTGIGLHFQENTLGVSLSGNPIAPRR